MESSRAAGSTVTASEAFAAFLIGRRELEAIDFEAFCASHPDLAPRLRQLYAEREHAIGEATGTGESLHERLARRYGKDSDPDVSLHGDPLHADPWDSGEAGDGTPASETLRRLEEEGPHSSRYAIRDEVARGGMGVVFRVWDRDLRRNLAMKVVLDEADLSPMRTARTEGRVLARFLEEAQITGQLDHPGIIPVHELGLDAQGRVFFTMPLLRGRELKEIIGLVREGREGWTLAKALTVVLKVCEAVAYAHSKQVVHRDLKPSNIIVGRFGETYVMDWGLARVVGREDTRDLRIRPETDEQSAVVDTELEELRGSSLDSPLVTMDGAVVGTPSYMPPEQAMGMIEELGPRSDVYSIGAILYHLLTGRMPYVPPEARMSPRTVLLALLQGPPQPVRELAPQAPAELAAICEKAMRREPGRRYASPLDLAHDVEAYLGHRPVTAHEGSVGYALRLSFLRNKATFLTAAAALMVLVGAAVVLLWRENRSLAIERQAIEERRRTYDVQTARVLPAEADFLHPAVPAMIEPMEDWLAQVENLMVREAWWREPADVVTDVTRRQRQTMVDELERIPDLRRGVERRLEMARELSAPEHERSWSTAIERIANAWEYDGLRFAPVEGLVPLGPNPDHGLWEFWNAPSGSRPAWQEGEGLGELRPEDGIVLVLLPSGELWMENPELEEEETIVDVAACYVAKHEVTQAQWLRVMGTNPSEYKAGLTLPEDLAPPGANRVVTALHPVENVSWYEASLFADRVGLSLLTEQQWEYACRANTISPWFWGETSLDLEGKVNLQDVNTQAFVPIPAARWDDGHALHAPIGSFPPNDFGLHEMHGNVSEWCQNELENDWNTLSERRVFRGGGYVSKPEDCVSGFRAWGNPAGRQQDRGLRVGLQAPLAE